MKIEAKRTSDERFLNLPNYTFSPNYKIVNGDLRMHYIDENSDSKNVIVMLHGQPSWSYLYRKMIPSFINENYRVIIPDLIGFGKSDKPIHQDDYTYQRHIDWVRELLFDHLQLEDIHIFIQDWGGLIGFRLIADFPEKFKTVTAANTFLPTGLVEVNEAFTKWQHYVKNANPFHIGQVIQGGTIAKLSDAEIAAYDAPYPDESYKAGAKIFPSLVPTTPDDPQAKPNQLAWKKLASFQKPFLTLFSDKDPIMNGLEKIICKLIPGTLNQPHEIIHDTSHFLQDEKGEEISMKILAWHKTLGV